MATKRITIEPDILVRILKYAVDAKGQPLIPVPIDKPYKVIRARYEASTHVFEMEVDSASFDEHPGAEKRMPQAFIIRL